MEPSAPAPRFVNAFEEEWKDHPRFAGVQMKKLLTPADNELANVSQVRVPPGSEVGRHVHATQVETVYILKGQGLLTIGDRSTAMTPGSLVAIPSGCEHSLSNSGSEPIELIAFFTPPIGQ